MACLLLVAVGCLRLDAAEQPLVGLRLTDCRGREWALDELPQRGPVVFAFLGSQCPLAKLYSPRLVALADRFGPRGVTFVAVNANVQDSLASMAAHARSSGISFPFLKDPDQALADRLGVTRTPEACLVDATGAVRYRGLIDDQFGIGSVRTQATREPLADAVEDVLAGREVAVPRTEPVGCLIGRGHRPAAAAGTGGITHAEQVSRILQRRCTSCHREGDIGPMDLTRYADVAAWSDMILEVVRERRMPPWHASPDHGTFANDRRMTAEEIETLERWVAAGMPEGDPARLPEPVAYAAGWMLPDDPDLVVSMRDRPFPVPATGEVGYQYFVVDPRLDRDVWMRGVEIVPGNRAVVHHILIFVKDPADTGRDLMGERGFLAGYVPGTRAAFLPEGHAKRIPRGHQLVFQVHYTPVGTPQEDLSRVGLWFADPATVTHEVRTTSALEHGFRIPPRAPDHRVTAVLPEDLPACDLLGMSPHMHLRGKSFRYTAIYPDGRREILLDVPRYDFNWQTDYRLASAKPMPKGTNLVCEAAFDNSAANPNNPDPDATVTWGDQTREEMMIGYVHVAVPVEPAAAASAR